MYLIILKNIKNIYFLTIFYYIFISVIVILPTIKIAIFEKYSIINRIELENLTRAKILGLQFRSMFVEAKAVLNHIYLEIDSYDYTKSIIDSKNLISNFNYISCINIINAEGDLVATTKNFMPKINYNDEIFQRHKNGQVKFSISGPILSKILNIEILSINQSYYDKNNNFVGVLVAEIEISKLNEILISQDFNVNSSLFTIDGMLIARNPSLGVGKKYNIKAVERINTGNTNSYYITNSAIDGIKRIVSYSIVKDYPLLIIVSSNYDQVLLSWKIKFLIILILEFITLSILAILSFFCYKHYRLLFYNKNRFEDFAKSSSDWLWEMDADLKFTWLSDRFEDISECSPQMLIGKSRKDIIIDTDKSMLETYINAINNHLPFRNFEYKTDMFIGNQYFQINGTPVFKNGKFVGYRGTGTDITNQISLKNQLYETKLKIAENTNKIKSEFLANMSHEIRTPLNGIIGMLNVISKKKLQKEQYDKYLSIVSLSTNKLLNIVNDILDFSKIEAGKLKINIDVFDLNTMVNDVIEIFNFQIKNKNLEIILEISPELPPLIKGDSHRIQQMLLNYITNAIKFTKEGFIKIKVEYLGKYDNDFNILIKVSVIDTGIGLTVEQKDYIFKDFSQIDSKFGGTGLGLVIVKKLAHLMKGDVGVDSTYGTGSTFWFTVVVNIDITSIDNVEQYTNKTISQNDCLILSGTKILLVEDDLVNQLIASNLLELVGISVDIADNGLIALEMFGKKEYEIILMDMRMPIMDGIEATKIIRKNNNEIPIIAMSANVLSEQKEECIKSGMNDFIGKPFNPNELYLMIYKWVTGSEDIKFVKDIKIDDNSGIKFPNNLDGLNLRTGLKRTSGLKSVFLNSLKLFLKEQKYVVQTCRELLIQNNLEQFSRQIHTLKGSSGFISAEEVVKLVLKIEKIDLQDKEKIDDYMNQLENKLLIVFQSIEYLIQLNDGEK